MATKTTISAWASKLLTSRIVWVCLLVFAGTGFLYTTSALRDPIHESQAAEVVHEAGSLSQSSTGNEKASSNASSYCDERPDGGNLALIVKTGATEALDRLPTQLVTSLRCVKDPIIVSDLEQTLGRHRIYDVLAKVDPDVMDQNLDFDIYRKQRAYVESGQQAELRSLGSLPAVHDGQVSKGRNAASSLDKYKVLHMVEKAWELQPGRDWYVFIDADTYLSWRNLLAFLEEHDSRQSWYFGSPSRTQKRKPTGPNSAHEGGGFILSGKLVRDWVFNHSGVANRWDKRISEMSSGSSVLADALDQELEVTMTDAAPMLSADEPALVPFGPESWCKSIVLLHNLDSRQLDELFQIEMARKTSQLLFHDLHNSAYKSGVPFKHDDWDNLADDAQFVLEVKPNDIENFHGQWEPKDLVDPHKSFLGCELACIQNEKCFQLSFQTTTAYATDSTTECFLSSVFRLGRPRELEIWDDKDTGKGHQRSWLSGWRSDRISRWVEEHNLCT